MYGTITDSAKGITRSINHALVELGHSPHREADLLKYIGPPPNVIFSKLMGVSDEATLTRAFELYRQRYIPVGYKENRLYDRMPEVLARLRAAGSSLYIATAKRQDTAQSVLDFLDIDQFFTRVHGCDLHRTKSDLLRDILADAAPCNQPTVMIGDRDTDFQAAAEVGIPSIGVRWGYGTDDELAQATAVAQSPTDLPDVIEQTARPVRRCVG